MVYSTSQKIQPKFWNDKKQRAKETASFPEYAELNNLLNALSSDVKTYHRQLIIDKEAPTIPKFKKRLNEFMMKTDANNSLFSFIESFIKEREMSNEFSAGTVKTYKTIYNHLKNFAIKRRSQIDFNDIDEEFFKAFNEYLYSPTLNNSKNYVKATTKHISK